MIRRFGTVCHFNGLRFSFRKPALGKQYHLLQLVRQCRRAQTQYLHHLRAVPVSSASPETMGLTLSLRPCGGPCVPASALEIVGLASHLHGGAPTAGRQVLPWLREADAA